MKGVSGFQRVVGDGAGAGARGERPSLARRVWSFSMEGLLAVRSLSP